LVERETRGCSAHADHAIAHRVDREFSEQGDPGNQELADASVSAPGKPMQGCANGPPTLASALDPAGSGKAPGSANKAGQKARWDRRMAFGIGLPMESKNC